MKKPTAQPLMLDDIRDVKDCYLYGEKIKLEDKLKIPRGSWKIVRNYDQFVFSIKNHGVPTHVSFDNDLCPNHYEIFIKAASEGGFLDWQFVQPKMGLHALEFLIDFCNKEKIEIPIIYIHTANHLAREEMQNILRKNLTNG
jgi:hypothetical protein